MWRGLPPRAPLQRPPCLIWKLGVEDKSPLSALAIFRLLSFLLAYPAGARLQAVSCFSFESQFESMCEEQDMSLGGNSVYQRGGDAHQKF